MYLNNEDMQGPTEVGIIRADGKTEAARCSQAASFVGMDFETMTSGLYIMDPDIGFAGFDVRP